MGRLIELTWAEQEARRALQDRLRVEFGVEALGQRLEGFAGLDADTFVEEVRKRRPKAAGRLSPAALQELRKAHADHVPPVRRAGPRRYSLNGG